VSIWVRDKKEEGRRNLVGGKDCPGDNSLPADAVINNNIVAACRAYRERERERKRESFIRNNVHNGVVSGAAR